MKTNPVFLGIANAILPGLGYLILKERVVFGWLLLIGTIALVLSETMDFNNMARPLFLATTLAGKWLEGFWMLITGIAFGYDAYDLARQKRIATSVPPTA